METRLTLRPGQSGTKKLVARFGERLVRVRYLYDAKGGRRLKTVELIVESVPWQPRARHPRRHDDEIVAVRISFRETGLRSLAWLALTHSAPSDILRASSSAIRNLARIARAPGAAHLAAPRLAFDSQAPR